MFSTSIFIGIAFATATLQIPPNPFKYRGIRDKTSDFDL